MQHIFVHSFFSRVIGCNVKFSLHVHILCIPCDTVLANTAVLSMRARNTYRLFVGTWRPRVNFITTLNAACVRALSLHCVKKIWQNKSLGIIFIPSDTFVPNFCFFRGPRCWANPWRQIGYSVTHPAYLVPRQPKLALRN